MAISNTIRPGRHFLQIPGPTNVPDRVLRAMDYPTIDHRGPDFAELGLRVLDRIKLIFKTSEPVIIFPASGTGAWEAAMVNTLSAGDKILMFETGHFSTLWYDIAHKFKLEIDFVKDCNEVKNFGVNSVAICSNDVKNYPEDSFENMIEFSKDNKFNFPYLIDETQKVAKNYDAVCTPDFFGYNKELKKKN